MKRMLLSAARLAALMLVAFSVVLTPYDASAPARAAVPRLVVFEGFYNPG